MKLLSLGDRKNPVVRKVDCGETRFLGYFLEKRFGRFGDFEIGSRPALQRSPIANLFVRFISEASIVMGTDFDRVVFVGDSMSGEKQLGFPRMRFSFYSVDMKDTNFRSFDLLESL